MNEEELLPHLFRTEFRKIVSVLSKLFGLEHIAIAEDIVSDTFLLASETWGKKGLPDNATAWLYTVAKNKTKDYFKRNDLFKQKISIDIKNTAHTLEEMEIDLSSKNINDSQLQMMFAICHPSIPTEAQIGLSLRILCGFGIDEIADAFLSNKETINKRLFRAKEKLREENINMNLPSETEMAKRLQAVLTTLYLLFNEGYYSATQNIVLRKDLCAEAMYLTLLLTHYEITNQPLTKALLALMCFHASRFATRLSEEGEIILYEDQNFSLWDNELIKRGEYYLNLSAKGKDVTKYHLEAAIAYWHTQPTDKKEKWDNILQLYNKLLQIEYSPVAALNRTYATAKVHGNTKAIEEAYKLNLQNSHLYYSLLGHLYSTADSSKALQYFNLALLKAKTEQEKQVINKKIEGLSKA
jgi:RNA polymerase sigma factor (sigma-70 family)